MHEAPGLARLLVERVHASQERSFRNPVRFVPGAVRVEDEHAFLRGIIGADRRDVTHVRVPGENALDEIGEQEIIA